MIEYYMMLIHKNEYTTWITVIEMDNDYWHVAVLIPVAGGRLVIADPTWAYLTTTWLGAITANPVYEELARYSNHWYNHGGVKYIELYEIDVYNGSYRIVAKGGFESVAQSS